VREISVDNSGRVTGVSISMRRSGKCVKERKRCLVRQRLGSRPPFVLLSKSALFPEGPRELERMVGKSTSLSGNGVTATRLFRASADEYKGVISGAGIVDYVAFRSKRGFYGGGRLTARGYQTPLGIRIRRVCLRKLRVGARDTRRRCGQKPTQDDDQLFRHADASRNNRRDSGPRCERRLGPARDRITSTEPSRTTSRTWSSSGRSPSKSWRLPERRKYWAPPIGDTRAARHNRAPADGNDPQDIGGGQISPKPTMCPTCSSLDAGQHGHGWPQSPHPDHPGAAFRAAEHLIPVR